MNEESIEVSRRNFLRWTVAGTAVAMAPKMSGLRFDAQQSAEQDRWLNEPKHWHWDGQSLEVTADPKTDFWRKTWYGYVTDNGHFLHRSLSGDFTAEVKFSGKYHDLYDQAGLMVRENAQTWMKCGVEFVDGKQNISAVLTRDFSDWSTVRLPAGTGAVWMRVVRKGPALDILYSLDGSQWTECRQSYLTAASDLLVGPMCAAPEGQGFDVRFENWKIVKK